MPGVKPIRPPCRQATRKVILLATPSPLFNHNTLSHITTSNPHTSLQRAVNRAGTMETRGVALGEAGGLGEEQAGGHNPLVRQQEETVGRTQEEGAGDRLDLVEEGADVGRTLTGARRKANHLGEASVSMTIDY